MCSMFFHSNIITLTDGDSQVTGLNLHQYSSHLEGGFHPPLLKTSPGSQMAVPSGVCRCSPESPFAQYTLVPVKLEQHSERYVAPVAIGSLVLGRIGDCADNPWELGRALPFVAAPPASTASNSTSSAQCRTRPS